MSAGKGDTPRAVNGDRYRRNFDHVFSDRRSLSSEEFDHMLKTNPSSLVTEMRVWDDDFPTKTKRPYPSWICAECGRKHGRRPEGNPYGATYHIDTCGICGAGGVEVTECRDFGHLREGWDE
jgi:hypothetical protein